MILFPTSTRNGLALHQKTQIYTLKLFLVDSISANIIDIIKKLNLYLNTETIHLAGGSDDGVKVHVACRSKVLTAARRSYVPASQDFRPMALI